MATYTTRAPKGGERPALFFLASAALMIGAPVALATYAKSRPASEATCETTQDILFADARPVNVMSCRIAGVETVRIVRDVVTGEEIR